MNSIDLSELDTTSLQLLEAVMRTGNPLTITKNGEAVAQLVPAGSRAKTLIGLHKGQVTVKGNIHLPAEQHSEANK